MKINLVRCFIGLLALTVLPNDQILRIANTSSGNSIKTELIQDIIAKTKNYNNIGFIISREDEGIERIDCIWSLDNHMLRYMQFLQ